jgi:formylglycine-generating enzyme
MGAPAFVPFPSQEPAWEPEDRCDRSFEAEVGCDVRPPTCDKPCRHPVVKADCRDGFCRIPRGCFVANAPLCEVGRGGLDEPPRQMTLTHDFALQDHELTQAEWTAVGFLNPSTDVSRGGERDCKSADCPVGNVSWLDALSYANRLSELHGLAPCFALEGCTGAVSDGIRCDTIRILASSPYACTGYRLPTATEWQYAVRGGTATSYFTGSMARPSCWQDEKLEAHAWYCANSQLETRPVRGRLPNPWGLYDMLGNASEWNQDTVNLFPDEHLVDYFAEHRDLADGDELRIFRGGAVHSSPDIFPAARCLEAPRSMRGPTGGFRLARTLPSP